MCLYLYMFPVELVIAYTFVRPIARHSNEYVMNTLSALVIVIRNLPMLYTLQL